LKPSLRTVIRDIATLENMAIKTVVLINTELSRVKLAKNRDRPINIKMATNNVVRNITPDVLTSVVEILLTLNTMSFTLVAYLYKCPKQF
jgi:predicted DNA-binding transcriptional regulator YafY